MKIKFEFISKNILKPNKQTNKQASKQTNNEKNEAKEAFHLHFWNVFAKVGKRANVERSIITIESAHASHVIAIRGKSLSTKDIFGGGKEEIVFLCWDAVKECTVWSSGAASGVGEVDFGGERSAEKGRNDKHQKHQDFNPNGAVYCEV
jgi:hypothetical protein